jgi:hypothetical protein
VVAESGAAGSFSFQLGVTGGDAIGGRIGVG